MNKLDALRELLAKVEAGEIPDTGVDRFSAIPRRGGGVYADPNWYDANAAYWRGSLDAAKALHESVLGGWIGLCQTSGRAWVNKGARSHYAQSDNPARAWLIAILKALIAQDEHP